MTTETEQTDAPTRGRRGPYASTPARKAEIVRAASASFAEHGFERASLRDIASRANLTHAALLRQRRGESDDPRWIEAASRIAM